MKGVIRYSGARPLWAHTRNVQSQSGAGAYSQMQTLVLCDLKLRWQMTQFSMGATVSANKTSQTPAAISWSHETSSFFFAFWSTTTYGWSSTFPELVTSKIWGKYFPQESPGWKHHIPKLQRFWPFHHALERILYFPLSDIWKRCTLREVGCLTLLVTLESSREFQAVFSNTLRFELCCCLPLTPG